MLTLSEAQDRIFADIRPVQDTEILPLAAAHGRYVAAELRAQVNHPGFDNSAMDGYALRTTDLEGNHFALPLQGESSCGNAPAVLKPETAMRIFTGAPLPQGADTVVIQEDVKIENGCVVVPKTVRANQNIRRQGEDFNAGDQLYSEGKKLSSYDLALLATAGVAEVSVYRRPRALVDATGNELEAPGTPLKPGQIYESNRLATLLQLQELGVDVIDGGVVRDDPAALRELLRQSAEFDFIVTSGGVSVGDYDLVKQVFAEIGEINFWKVKIKPGKPVAFGRVGDRCHFFALPGNPVSSLVTFKLFVEPAVIVWHHGRPENLELEATAANSFRRRPGRMEFLRAKLYSENGRLMAQALPGQGSHMLGPFRETNGFIKLSEDSTGFKQGDSIIVRLLI